MTRMPPFPRWRSIVTVASLVALLAVALHVSAPTASSSTPALWTERRAGDVAPAASVDWVPLVRTLKPAVVNISTTRDAKTADDALTQFFGHFMTPGTPRPVRSLGSGFIVNADGFVVTNNHVVEDATEIRVRLSDGRELAGRLLGRDPQTDLALLKIDASGLPVIPLGDSAHAEVGEPVMAIGNPFGLAQTVTTGIVSATGRVLGDGPYDDFIQTDASINPGNSGGPLINRRGEAIGINAAIFTQSGGSVGIGFAIPVNLAKPVIGQLAAQGHVVRGWLGVTLQPVTPDLARALGLDAPRGALVTSVAEDAPARRAGVRTGDVIVAWDGHPIARTAELPPLVAATPVGRAVSVEVLREGRPLRLTASVGRQVAEADATEHAPATPAGLGLAVQPLRPDVAQRTGLPAGALLVRGVRDGGPAARAGLEPGDVIVEADHRPVRSLADLEQAVGGGRHAPVLLLVVRDQTQRFVALAV